VTKDKGDKKDDEKPPRKIAMCGTAPSTRDLIPWDTDWEVWGQADCTHDATNPSRWFDIAPFHRIVNEFPDYHEWQKKIDFPIYMREHFPEVPKSVPFPFDEVASRYGVEFMTATLTWMMGLACMEHERGDTVGVIGLFGYDMALDSEYCVAPETNVLTDDLRWVQAGSLKEGDGLIAYDENPGGDPSHPSRFRQWRHAFVEKTQTIIRPCYRIHMADGTEIVASAEHRWLVDIGNELVWRETDKLVTKYHNKVSKTRIVKLTDVWEEDTSWGGGYLAAAFDGEGWLSQIHRKECNGILFNVGYAQRDNVMADVVLDLAASKGYRLTTNDDFSDENGCRQYRVSGLRRDALKFLGNIRPRRLLESFDPTMLGTLRQRESIAVEAIEYVGERPVIGLKTNTGTFIAEGFASHNSFQRPGIKHMQWICEHYMPALGLAPITVMVPNGSDLALQVIPYPFADDNPDVAKIRARKRDIQRKRDYLSQQRAKVESQLQEIKDNQIYMNGAMEDVNYWERRYVGHQNSAT